MILAGNGARFESTESARAVNRDQKGRRVRLLRLDFLSCDDSIPYSSLRQAVDQRVHHRLGYPKVFYLEIILDI
jgi:hypothetical protein